MHDDRIDSVRVFCNILLIVTHAYPAMYSMGKDAEFWFCTFVSMKLCIMLLPTLFLLSGYLFFTTSRGGGWSEFLLKIRSRIRRLIVPFWSWNCLFVLFFFLIGLISERSANRLALLGCNSFMGILQNCFLNVVNPPPDGPVWYLRAVFVFCLLGPFFYVVIRLLNRYLVILLLVIAVACGKYPSPYPMYGLAAFVVGGIMAYHKINLVDFFLERRKMFLSVAMGAVVASFLIHFLGYTNISEPADIFKFLSMPIFICLADRIHILMNNQLIKKWIFPAAFTIYCSHMIVNSIAMHALGGAMPPFHGRMIIISVLTIAIDIIVPLCIWNILNKVCPKFLKIIDGRL